jgi:hypothetical protein
MIADTICARSTRYGNQAVAHDRESARRERRQPRQCWCGIIGCVCAEAERHDPDCPWRKALLCSVGIECEHGYDVCPTCDACTCKARAGEASERLSALRDDGAVERGAR